MGQQESYRTAQETAQHPVIDHDGKYEENAYPPMCRGLGMGMGEEVGRCVFKKNIILVVMD